jgi:hypothetical protein
MTVMHPTFGSDCLFAFGMWADLVVYENCNQNTKSFSSLGSSYEPVNREDNSIDKTYLAGSHHFRVLQVEAYLYKAPPKL